MSFAGLAVGPSVMGQRPDIAEVARALALLTDPDPGSAFELRAVALSGGVRPAAVSQLFNLASINQAVEWAKERAAERTVYIGLNPVPSGLPIGPGRAVRAADVLRRRWLLVDVDPVRALGYERDSATPAEKAAAVQLAGRVWDYLRAAGLPEPVQVDSGNGGYLLFRTDLPNDVATHDLVRRLLARLGSLFHGADGRVDEGVHDAPRIVKLPGVWARKGPGTAERPHRLCQLTAVPNPVRVVTREQLLAVAASAEGDGRPSADAGGQDPTLGFAGTAGGGGGSIVDRAAAYMAACPPAVSGHGGHGQTLIVARAVVWGFDLGPDVGFDLLWQRYNPRCQPPWTERELRHKCQEADTVPFDKPRGWLLLEVRQEPPAAAGGPGGLALTPLSTIAPQPVRWLVPDFLPLGKLCLFAGDGGYNKSTLSLALAAAVTTGAPAFGLQYAPPPPGDVLLVNCEDDYGDTVVPRLLALGADLARCHRVDGVRGADGKLTPFNLAHCEAVEQELARRPGVNLIVIDPAGAYIGAAGVDDHKDSQLRALLGPLAEMAARRRVCVLLIKHLNRNVTASAVNRVMGSSGYVNTVRTAWLIVPDGGEAGGDDSRRLLLRLKGNVPPPKSGLAFRPVALSPEEAAAILDRFPGLEEQDRASLGKQLFRLEWLGPVDKSPDAALGGAGQKKPKDVERAAEWLKDYLAPGPAPSDVCVFQGNQALHAAHDSRWWREQVLNSVLGGKAQKTGFGARQRWWFTLPAHAWPPPENMSEKAPPSAQQHPASQHSQHSQGDVEKEPIALEFPSSAPAESAESAETQGAVGSVLPPSQHQMSPPSPGAAELEPPPLPPVPPGSPAERAEGPLDPPAPPNPQADREVGEL